jgi:predicted short-subunit dehydrogenase-like oxidoreductase (DUF2520 family)
MTVLRFMSEPQKNSALRKRWAIVGAGRLGTTLGLLAEKLGITVDATWNRTPDAARHASEIIKPEHTYHARLSQIASRIVANADVIWITVVDSEIAAAARDLAPYLVDDQLVLHAAGSLSSSVLRDAGIPGPVASLHPLQAITDPRRAVVDLSKNAWTIEGDAPAVQFAHELMAQIGVEPVEIESARKTLYHASAVTAANLIVALMDAAFEMAEHAGMTRQQARRLMLPLAHSCIANLERQDTAHALSGPAARGDQTTIDRHLHALQQLDDPQLAEIYEVLTARALNIAAGD